VDHPLILAMHDSLLALTHAILVEQLEKQLLKN
jgi:hypothetical protein